MAILKRFIPITILVIILLLGALAIKEVYLQKKVIRGPVSGIVKPYDLSDDFSFKALDDNAKNFTKADLLGHYSMINVFASWCITCLAEHDVLMNLADHKIINIYGIAFKDLPQNTKKYLDQHGNPYNEVMLDGRGNSKKILGLDGVPHTLILNKAAQVIYVQKGNLRPDIIDFIFSLDV